MTDREAFKDNLLYLLKTTGKMQKDLADYVGAKYTTVSGWTRGISYPRADAMEKIAMFFGITTSQLIGKRLPLCIPDPSTLTETEKRIIDAYRTVSPDTQKAVQNVLGIKE